MANLKVASLELLFLASTIGRYFTLDLLEDASKAHLSTTKKKSYAPVDVLTALVEGMFLLTKSSFYVPRLM